MIYLFPGMGADRRMYPDPWHSLTPRQYVEWPSYAGETSIHGLAKRIIADQNIKPDNLLVGSSLGGIAACEIAKMTPVSRLVLVGSAKSREEINRFISLSHPLIDLTPLRFTQRLAGSVPCALAQMFTDTEPEFIRAIFDWEKLGDVRVNLLRIHGKAGGGNRASRCLLSWNGHFSSLEVLLANHGCRFNTRITAETGWLGRRTRCRVGEVFTKGTYHPFRFGVKVAHRRLKADMTEDDL